MIFLCAICMLIFVICMFSIPVMLVLALVAKIKNSNYKKYLKYSLCSLIATVVMFFVTIIIANNTEDMKKESDHEIVEVDTEQTIEEIESQAESESPLEEQGTVIEEETMQSIDSENEITTEIEGSSTPEEESSSISMENEFLSDLKSVMGEDVAETAYDILKNQIGFSSLVYKQKMGDTSNYEILADSIEIVMTAMDDYFRVFIPNSSYVLYEDGTVLMTASQLSDRTIDNFDMNSYYIMAQEIVKNALKNPSSAKFPSIVTSAGEIAMQKNGDIVAVQSYVDAKNSFNAKVRSKWIAEFRVVDLSTYSYEVIYLRIEDESYGEFIELD